MKPVPLELQRWWGGGGREEEKSAKQKPFLLVLVVCRQEERRRPARANGREGERSRAFKKKGGREEGAPSSSSSFWRSESEGGRPPNAVSEEEEEDDDEKGAFDTHSHAREEGALPSPRRRRRPAGRSLQKKWRTDGWLVRTWFGGRQLCCCRHLVCPPPSFLVALGTRTAKKLKADRGTEAFIPLVGSTLSLLLYLL